VKDDTTTDRRQRDTNTEHLIDIERPDTLFRAPFRETVEQLCGDVGATVDWTTWRLNAQEPKVKPLHPRTTELGVKLPARSPLIPPPPPG